MFCEIRPSIFSCFHVWWHVSWESRLRCGAGYSLDQFGVTSLIRLGWIGTCIIDTAWDRHSNKTVTLRKYVTKYKNMQKWMVEFRRKSESRGDKIARFNSICITKSINLLWFCMGLGSVVMEGDFQCTAQIFQEVYDWRYYNDPGILYLCPCFPGFMQHHVYDGGAQLCLSIPAWIHLINYDVWNYNKFLYSMNNLHSIQ